MGEWIDFRELRSRLKFTDVLEKYQVRLQIRNRGTQATGPCPLPTHGNNRTKQTFSANLEKGIFQCFSCEAKGNVLDFACRMEGLNPENGDDLRTAALRIAEHFKLRQERPQKTAPTKRADTKPCSGPKDSSQVAVNALLDFELKELDPTHEYLTRRRIEPETAKFFGIGFCKRGRMAGRIAIPIHDPAGKLVGYAGRIVEPPEAPKDVPKYLFPGTRTHKGVTYEFKKSLLLYNAHRIARPIDDLTIVEGFASVWWLRQCGFPDSVAVMGNSISEQQADIALSLVSPCGRVSLISDGDEAGEKLAEQASKIFEGQVEFRALRLRDTNQPTDMNAGELVELLRPPKPAGIGGGFSPRDDISELLNQFPCFENLGITPDNWDAEAFDAKASKFSSGELSAAQFLLGVWNPTTPWKCGKFDLIEAAARLDEEHRQVINDWFSDPWWP